MPDPRALVFDVFGTVVDRRSAVVRDGEALGREKHLDVGKPIPRPPVSTSSPKTSSS
jgi:FMN phosphatase YigB (HAD superfamily)